MDFKFIVIFLLVRLHCVATSHIEFSSSVTTIKHLVTDQMTIRCSLRDSQAAKRPINILPQDDKLDIITSTSNSIQHDVLQDSLSTTNNIRVEGQDSQPDLDADSRAASEIKFASSLVITRNGADVATISSYAPATSFDNSTGVQVSGQISGTGPEPGYLQVTWAYPGPDQQGTYTCTIGGFDMRGHPVTVSKSVDVSDTEVTMRDLVTYIREIQLSNRQQTDTISNMNATISDMNATISDMNTTIIDNVVTIENLETKDKLNSATIQYLVKNDDLNSASIANLTSNISTLNATVNHNSVKLNTHVIFTAGLTSHISNSHALIFNQVITNIGGDYNATTGVFTCRIPGTYLFLVHVLNNPNAHMDVFLHHNGNAIARMYASSGQGYDSASNSATLYLVTGDTVYVYTGTGVDSGSTPTSTFTGLLLAPA